jgi:hypothetical protein
MPSLQLDVPIRLEVGTKRLLAKRFGLVYAAKMEADPELVTVSIHDLGEGSVWRCTADEPQPHSLIMCDVRRGQSAETRAALAPTSSTVTAHRSSSTTRSRTARSNPWPGRRSSSAFAARADHLGPKPLPQRSSRR